MDTKKCPYCAEDIQEDALKCKHCGSWVAAPPERGDGALPPAALAEGGPPFTQRLVRSARNRRLSGLCGGVGLYLGMDPTLVRVLYVVITFFTGLVPGILLYLILSFIIPAETDLAP